MAITKSDCRPFSVAHGPAAERRIGRIVGVVARLVIAAPIARLCGWMSGSGPVVIGCHPQWQGATILLRMPLGGRDA